MKFTPVAVDRGGVYGIHSIDEKTLKHDVGGDFPSIPGGTDNYQVSAAQLANTSTIFFQPGVSSIVFDLSAEEIDNVGNITNDSAIDIVINNATTNAYINKDDDTSVEQVKRVSLREEYKLINLYLSAAETSSIDVSANYRVDGSTTVDPGNNLLSCVNLWDFFNVSDVDNYPENLNAFSAVSADFAVSASFTLH